MYYSTDNGTTWVNTVFPIGTLSTVGNVCSDAYRFYSGVNGQPQILTSADGITWTIATSPVNFRLGSNDAGFGYGSICSFDSNTVVLCGQLQGLTYARQYSTADGGVTWTYAAPNYKDASYAAQPQPGDCWVTPDAGGFGFAGGNQNPEDFQIISKADTTANGAFYRTGDTAITPVRTGAFSYVRVG
jgi:hypothetical protein